MNIYCQLCNRETNPETNDDTDTHNIDSDSGIKMAGPKRPPSGNSVPGSTSGGMSNVPGGQLRHFETKKSICFWFNG